MGLLRGIFFDLDDTLINSTVAMTAALQAIQPLLPERSVPELAELLKQAYLRLWGYGTPGYAALKTLPTRELRRQLTQAALQELESTDVVRLEEIVDRYESAENAALKPVAGAHELLTRLQPHFRLGVITNGPSVIQREKLARAGLSPYFDVVVADADFGVPKPAPELFAFAAALLGLSAGELVFVGDSLEADVRGANAAGWTSVLVGARAPEADFCLSRLEELLTLPALVILKGLASGAKVADTIEVREPKDVSNGSVT